MQKHSNQTYTKTASALALTVASFAMTTDAWAKEEFAAQLGVSDCTLCHERPEGGNPVRPEAKAAYNNGGVIPGLQNFLKSLATDAKPEILPIDNEWNAQIGELPLSIPLIIKDEEQSGFLMELASAAPSLAPKSYSFSKLYLEATKKRPTIDFKWFPSSKQKLTKYTVTFRASEVIDAGTKQFSKPVKTNIFLWAARPVSPKNVIEQFIVSSAKWSPNRLTLTGRVVYKKTATAAARAKKQKMTIKSNLGTVVGSPAVLDPNPKTGAWTHSFTLTAKQVPCLVKAEFEKLNAARTVKAAPATCKK